MTSFKKQRVFLRSIALLVLFSPAVLLAEESATKLAKGNDYSSYFIKMIFSMLLIIGMLAAFAWYTRRFGMGVLGHKPNDKLKIVSMLSLGAKERVVMVQAGEDQLILGIASGEIKKLHVIRNVPHKSFSQQLSTEITKNSTENPS